MDKTPAMRIGPAGSVFDDFTANNIGINYTTTGTWTVSGGQLHTVTNQDPHFAIHNGITATDMGVRAAVSSHLTATIRYPGVVLRAADTANLIFARLTVWAIEVFDVVAGVATKIGQCTPAGVPVQDYVSHTLDVEAVGTTVTVSFDAQHCGTLATTITTSGKGGLSSSGTGLLANYDDLLIWDKTATAQPVPPGRVLEWGAATGAIGGEDYSGATGTLILRDEYGAPIATGAASGNSVVY
jgi:hypothetical protein